MAPLTAYKFKPDGTESEACVLGFDVLYSYEPADPSVGISEARYILAVKVGGVWLSLPDAFTEDFGDLLHAHIADAVHEAAADDFDIPEAA